MKKMRLPFPANGTDQHCNDCGRLLIEFHGDGTISIAEHIAVKGMMEGDGDDVIGGAVEGICLTCHPEEREDMPAPIRSLINSLMNGGIKEDEPGDGRIKLPWEKQKPKPEPEPEAERVDLSSDEIDESTLSPMEMAMREIIRHRIDPFKVITPPLMKMGYVETAEYFTHQEISRALEMPQPPPGAHMACDFALGAWVAGWRPEGWPDKFPDMGLFVSHEDDEAKKAAMEIDKEETPHGGEQST